MKTTEPGDQLEKCFAVRKWKLETVARLPAAFVLPNVVTPFFQPRVLRRSENRYLIDGYIGVMHRQFEALWVASNPEFRRANSHCLALNIANFESLRKEQHLSTGRVASGIEKFSALTTSLLDVLPRDERCLATCFDQEQLMDIPLTKFIVGSTTKFLALKRFILQSRHSLN